MAKRKGRSPMKQLSGQLLDSLERIDFGNRTWVLNNMAFMFFVCFLALIYIANARFAERTMSQIKDSQTELRELRWQYLTTKAELMYGSKQAEVSKLVKPYGLQETKHPVKKMIIEQESER